MRDLVKRYPGVLALDHVGGAIRAGVRARPARQERRRQEHADQDPRGRVQPDEGEILIDGEPVASTARTHATQLGLAFVHQELADVPNLTVAENIELGLGYPKKARHLRRPARALRRKTRDDVLERLGAGIDPEALGSQPQRRRSGGWSMIARGPRHQRTPARPRRADRVADRREIDHLHGIVRGCSATRGVAVLYVTHRLEEIFEVTDHVAVMRDGRIVYSGRDRRSSPSGELIEHITGACRGRARAPRAPRHARRPWATRSCCASRA